MKIEIPVSVGELLDKISILQIKSKHTDNEYIKRELEDLIGIAQHHNVYIQSYLTELLQVNHKLWDIEDELRLLEKQQDFSQRFVDLARSVYITNDERASIKRKINDETESYYREIKLY
jgi:hypothetical protein